MKKQLLIGIVALSMAMSAFASPSSVEQTRTDVQKLMTQAAPAAGSLTAPIPAVEKPSTASAKSAFAVTSRTSWKDIFLLLGISVGVLASAVSVFIQSRR